MAKYTPYALSTLPTSGIDVNGIYFIPDTSGVKFNVFIRKNDNSVWIDLGTVNSVDSVNALTGNVQLDLALSAAGVLSLTGSSATVNLDARYRKNADTVPWSAVSSAPSFALDSAVVHNTGDEVIAGTKTFSASPIVPNATGATQAAAKGQIDTAIAGLQTQINALNTTVSSGLHYKGALSASANPNYPTAAIGDVYIITVAGKIGGASGANVQIGDMLVCNTANSGGTQASVGVDWVIIQANLDQATETVAGIAAIATQAEVTAGSDDATIVTPLKLAAQNAANNTAQNTVSDGKYVRYDVAQSLNATQKTTATSNIGAAQDAAVVHNVGLETIGGAKTFAVIPVLPPSDPTADNQAARKLYVDETAAAVVQWGGANGKEW